MNADQLLRTILVERRATFLIVLILSMAVAGAVVAILPKQYDATALLFIGADRPVDAAGVSQRDDVLARSYTALLAAPAVADEALKRAPKGVSRSGLLNRMSFELVAGTQLISVKATDGSPEGAARFANAYADSFIATRATTDLTSRRQRTAQLSREIEDALSLVNQLQGSKAPGNAGRLDAARTRLSSLRSAYGPLQQNNVQEGPNVSLASPARVPAAASAPKPVLYLAAAFVLGLFLAAAAALARDRFDSHLTDEHAIVDLAQVPILTRIPKVRRSARSSLPSHQAFAFLRANLTVDDGEHTIVVTSPSPGDGKTTVSEGLARSLAASDVDVLLADCDFRRADLTVRFGELEGPGLLDVMTGRADLADVLRPTSTDRLRLAPGASESAGQIQEFSRRKAGAMLDLLRRSGDYLVCDTAPVTAASETSILASLGHETVVLVVDPRSTTRPDLIAALEQLRQSGADLRGLVINRAARSRIPEYHYGQDPPRLRRASPPAA